MITTIVNFDLAQTTLMIVVIEKDNLERMKKSDPITLEPQLLGGALPVIKYPKQFRVLIAYEEDEQKMHEIINEKGLGGLIHYLERGMEFKKGIDGMQLAFSLTKPPKES